MKKRMSETSITLKILHDEMRATFRNANIASADLDARILLAHALDISQARLISDPGRLVSVEDVDRAHRLMHRRLSHEPVSKIISLREFWGRPFRINHNTLDPRTDTETAIEAALKIIQSEYQPDDPLSFLDLGTGSGCILLTLLAERENAWGVGVDTSIEALEIAEQNSKRLGLDTRAEFIKADWASSINAIFDVVIANPPYIRTADIDGLMPEVRDFDPRGALDGGEDGLDAYRQIIAGLGTVLTTGWVVFELGAGQLDDVLSLLKSANFGVESSDRLILSDLSGTIRTVAARQR